MVVASACAHVDSLLIFFLNSPPVDSLPISCFRRYIALYSLESGNKGPLTQKLEHFCAYNLSMHVVQLIKLKDNPFEQN
jgi:hypothetical protein